MASEKKVKSEHKQLNLTDEQQELVNNSEVEILDVHAFLKYHELKKYCERVRQCTIDNLTVDLGSHNDPFYAKIMDLPDALQAKFESKKKNYTKIHNNMLNFKKTAFGIGKNKPDGLKKSQTLLISKRLELLELFGRMYSVKEVYAIIRDEWKSKELSLNDLTQFYVNNFETIQKQIELHRNDYSKLRLTAKTSRLEELGWTATILKRKIQKTESREDIKAFKDILAEIRKECEGERMTIEGSLNMNIQADVNVHIRSQLATGINLKEIIIGKIAAKNNLSAAEFVKDLNGSYYAKLNHFISDMAEDADFDILGGFPSQQPYDFEKIRRINENADAEEKQAIQIKQIQEKDKPKSDIKDRLLDKIRNSTRKVNESHNANIKRTI